MVKIKKKDIAASLRRQLAFKGAALEHYEDLISDYMALWEIKNDLIKDIKTRGVSFIDCSAAGKEMWKNNPSCKDLVGINRQMLSILKELKLSTDEVGGGDKDDL